APRRPDFQAPPFCPPVPTAQLHRRLGGRRRDFLRGGGEWEGAVGARGRLARGQELFSAEVAAGRQQQRPFERVLQLADVAGPGMRAQLLAHTRSERWLPHAVLLSQLPEQRLRDEKDIVAAVTQRR